MFSKIRGTFFTGPCNKDENTLKSLLGPPGLGNYHKGMAGESCS